MSTLAMVNMDRCTNPRMSTMRCPDPGCQKLGLAGLLLCGLAFWPSCDNTLDLFGGDPEEALVWCLLDAQDTVHYARVQRSYRPESGSATTAAQDPDLLLFPEGSVSFLLEALDEAGTAVQRWEARRVDAASEGLPKDPGIFADSAHALYRLDAVLDPDTRYRVRFFSPADEDTLQTSFELVDSMVLLYPAAPELDIDYSDTGSFRFEWVNAQGANLYDAFWILRYEEALGGGPWVEKEVRLPLFRNRVHIPDGGATLLREGVNNSRFFSGMRGSGLAPAPPGSRRLLELKVEVAAGGEALYLLYLNNLATLDLGELFITGTYTNLEGALGIVSSRRTLRSGVLNLSVATLDSLACGRFTRDLGFLDASGNPCP
jgi:hypothetical protein